MLIYDVKKDEFVDVKADSYYWEYTRVALSGDI